MCMITWNEVRDKSFRDEAIHDDKYALIGNGSNGKPDALVIDLEFAKTLSGDVQAILKELIEPPKKTQKQIFFDNIDSIMKMNSDGVVTEVICKQYGICSDTLRRCVHQLGIEWRRNRPKTLKGYVTTKSDRC